MIDLDSGDEKELTNIPVGLMNNDDHLEMLDGQEVTEIFSTQNLPAYTTNGVFEINQ
jgi:hypothetical protein